MSAIIRAADGTRIQWGMDDTEFGRVIRDEIPGVRHAWKTSKGKFGMNHSTLCGAVTTNGEIINRRNVAKCPECVTLATPEPATVETSNVTTVGNAPTVKTFLVNLVWNNGTRDERFVVAHRGYDPAEWDTTKPYPMTAYACTCGAARGAGETNDSACEHIRAVIRHRAAMVQAVFQEG